MEETRDVPRMLQQINEAEMIIEQISAKLSHVLLPHMENEPSEKLVEGPVESEIVKRLRRLNRTLGTLSDRIES